MRDLNEACIPEAFANRMFFTDAQVAGIIGASHVSVARWRRQGYIKARYFGKRCVMIPRSEVERFIRGEIDFSGPPEGENKEP